jgi:DNA modification methylase
VTAVDAYTPDAPDPYYDDGTVTIYHGDCREILPTLAEPAAVVTDPPYGIGDWRGKPRAFTDDWGVTEAASTLWRSDLPLAVFANHLSLPRTLALVAHHHQRIRVGTWHKSNINGAGGGGNPWLADVEFYVLGVPAWPVRAVSGIVAAPRSTGNPHWQQHSPDAYLHPAQKPVAVMRHVLASLDFDGGVLDPFAGSGSTLRAAKDLGIRAVGIEIQERYCEIAARRMGQEVLDFARVAPDEDER